MDRMDLLVLFVVVLACTPQTFSTPNGAPRTGCVSMYPQHPGPAGPVSAQNGLLVPFQIQVVEQDGGRVYKFRVVRNPNFAGKPNLLGFFLQVRDPNSDAALGEFIDLPIYAKYGDCSGSNSITHPNAEPKPIDDGLEFTWVPKNLPPSARDLQVLGTFVQNMQTFWVKVPSQLIHINEEAAASLSTAPANPVIGSGGNAGLPNNFDGNNVQGTQQNNNNNDRKPGFGNSGSVQQPTFKVNNGGPSSFLAGLASILAGLVIAL